MQLLVGLIMGSTSDWETMWHAAQILEQPGVAREAGVISAYWTRDLSFTYAASAEPRLGGDHRWDRGRRAPARGGGVDRSAGARGAGPSRGTQRAQCPVLHRADARRSAVGTLAIGGAGAINAALLAVGIVRNRCPGIRTTLAMFRREQTEAVLAQPGLRDET